MSRSGKLRRAGAYWRVLVHRNIGDTRKSDMAHHIQSDRVRGRDNTEFSRTDVLPHTEFDELVVGNAIHIEQMDVGTYWANIAGVTIWLRMDRDGNPTSINVSGPGDYADPVDGCKYTLDWTKENDT
jgi:hypothetical protein